MAIDPAFLATMDIADVPCCVGARDAILYALSIGLGAQEGELPFVYEGAGLRAFPTMALVLGDPGGWWLDPRTGLGEAGPLHGAQSLEILRPIPLESPLMARNRITALRASKAGHAMVTVERVLRCAQSGASLAISRATLLFRGLGDGGGAFGPPDPPLPPPQGWQGATTIAIGATAAMLYRLNGDTNPLHIDPAAAGLAGFPAPILHGLLSMGLAAVALHRQWPAAPLRAMALRFSAPVYPDKVLTIDYGRRGAAVWFGGRVGGRQVLDRGHAVLDLA